MSAPTLHCTAVGCVIRPGHDGPCLPPPRRVTKCTPCDGYGQDPEDGFTCEACLGTGLAR